MTRWAFPLAVVATLFATGCGHAPGHPGMATASASSGTTSDMPVPSAAAAAAVQAYFAGPGKPLLAVHRIAAQLRAQVGDCGALTSAVSADGSPLQLTTEAVDAPDPIISQLEIDEISAVVYLVDNCQGTASGTMLTSADVVLTLRLRQFGIPA